MVIDWMLLLLKESSIRNRFADKSNYLKAAEVVMTFKKGCGNTIKVRFYIKSILVFVTNYKLNFQTLFETLPEKFATKNMPYALIQVRIIIQVKMLHN